jgi:hypothetical protein
MTEVLKVSVCPPAYEKIYHAIDPEEQTNALSEGFCRKQCTTLGTSKWLAWTCLAIFMFGLFAFVVAMLTIAGPKNSTKGGEQER